MSGTDLLSADGEIVAHFGGQAAATSCPSQTMCLVTVPPLSGSPRSVPVSITTDAGTSRTLTFDYLWQFPCSSRTALPFGRSERV